jgi:hypothetical protein
VIHSRSAPAGVYVLPISTANGWSAGKKRRVKLWRNCNVTRHLGHSTPPLPYVSWCIWIGSTHYNHYIQEMPLIPLFRAFEHPRIRPVILYFSCNISSQFIAGFFRVVQVFLLPKVLLLRLESSGTWHRVYCYQVKWCKWCLRSSDLLRNVYWWIFTVSPCISLLQLFHLHQLMHCFKLIKIT